MGKKFKNNNCSSNLSPEKNATHTKIWVFSCQLSSTKMHFSCTLLTIPQRFSYTKSCRLAASHSVEFFKFCHKNQTNFLVSYHQKISLLNFDNIFAPCQGEKIISHLSDNCTEISNSSLEHFRKFSLIHGILRPRLTTYA